MTNETHDRMYELLCAYVLGETNEHERAEVELALAGSAELRREKQRIEGTIGLVKTALVQDEALSPAARDEVLRAALPQLAPSARPWYRETWVRAAAGILFVSFALAGWSIYDQRASCPPQQEVAQNDHRSAETFDGAQPEGQFVSGEELRRVDDLSQLGTAKEEHLAANKPAGTAVPEAAPPMDGFLDRDAGPAHKDAEAPSRPQGSRSETTERLYGEGERNNFVQKSELKPLQGGAAGPGAQPSATSRGELPIGVLTASKNPAGNDTVSDKLYKLDDSTRDAKLRGELQDEQKVRELSLAAGTEKKSAPARAAPAATPGLAGPATGGPATPGLQAPASDEGRKRAGVSAGKPVFVDPAPPPRELAAHFERSKEMSESLRFGYDGRGDLVDAETQGVELSDEDRFILTKLGIGEPSWKSYTITPDMRVRYRDEYVTDWCRRVVLDCRPRPNEVPRDMFFRFWGDNPFEFAAVDALSTFSADVDTASYALARRYVNEGHLPTKEQVRTEEFVNYFKADVPAPESGTFAIHTSFAPSRFGAPGPGEMVARERDMLRVVVRAKDVPQAQRKPLALTFVVDCSGSMKEQDRIGMVKHAIRLLVSQLDARDTIAIVKFSTDAALVLPMTSAREKGLIESAIDPLVADGSTNSEAGLRMGYSAALAGLNSEATNRVVFLSDGVANVGVTDPNVISDEVKPMREKGIYLNTVGVGMNNHNDVLLEQLADKGDGVCNYVDTREEAKKVFVDDFMGAVETVARDVKLQVEFDPAQVYRYRLLGYENRAVADADFRNDKVDAGEVGAGHQVTALYEIEYAAAKSDPAVQAEKPLATVRVRFKQPRNPGAPQANEEASEIAKVVRFGQRTSWEGAGVGYRRAVLAGQFAEFLRRSYHARSDSFDQMIADAKQLELQAADKDVSELVTLMEKSKSLILNGWPTRSDELALAIDKVRENCVLRAQLERIASERDRALLAELELQNRKLEEQLREILRHRLDMPR